MADSVMLLIMYLLEGSWDASCSVPTIPSVARVAFDFPLPDPALVDLLTIDCFFKSCKICRFGYCLLCSSSGLLLLVFC